MGRKIHHKTRAAIVKRIKDGFSTTSILKEFGISSSTLTIIRNSDDNLVIRKAKKEGIKEGIKEARTKLGRNIKKETKIQVVESISNIFMNNLSTQAKLSLKLKNIAIDDEEKISIKDLALIMKTSQDTLTAILKNAKISQQEGCENFVPFEKETNININQNQIATNEAINQCNDFWNSGVAELN